MLTSTWKRKCNVCLSGFGYPTWDGCLSIHRFTYRFYKSNVINRWVISRYVNVLDFHDPFLSWLESRLFLISDLWVEHQWTWQSISGVGCRALQCMLRVVQLDFRVGLFPDVLGTLTLTSTVVVPVCVPISNEYGFHLPSSLLASAVICFGHLGQSDLGRVKSQGSFNLHCPDGLGYGTS